MVYEEGFVMVTFHITHFYLNSVVLCEYSRGYDAYQCKYSHNTTLFYAY